jgi:hypothetical protein
MQRLNIPAKDEFDFNREFRWAIGNDSNLSPIAKLILHTIALVMPSDGSGCFPGLKWIAEKSGIPYGTVKRYMMQEIRGNEDTPGWNKLSIEEARGRRGNTYTPNIDYDQAITAFVEAQCQREKLAGSPSDPPRHVDGSRNDPPTGLPDHLSDPPSVCQTVAGSPNPVAGSPNRVAGSPSDPLLYYSKTLPPEADASAASGASESFQSNIWKSGVNWLAGIYGTSMGEDRIRSRLGKLVKDHGESEVISALIAAEREKPIDPLNWITARLGRSEVRTHQRYDPERNAAMVTLFEEARSAYSH